MTLNEAAKRLGLQPGTLRVQINNGKLHGTKVGTVWTITWAELRRYRREHRRKERIDER